MRRAARVDVNQPEIVAELRERGASVELLHAIGKGCPDLLVGYRGVNLLAEVKDGRKRWKLTPDQLVWHDEWAGSVVVLECTDDAVSLLKRTDTMLVMR